MQEQEKRRRDDTYGQSRNNMNNQTATSQQAMDDYNNGNSQSGYHLSQKESGGSNLNSSNIHKEKRQPTKTCSWCNGTGKCSVNTRGQITKSCNLSFYNSNHLCKKEQCLICHATHCIEMSHKTCKVCDGKGKTW